MSIQEIKSYEVKVSKTGNKVPVVNGIHLHSIYNPAREAESLVAKYVDILQSKQNVLVFGLGFGYHINRLVSELSRIHGENYKIVVVEPNRQVYEDCCGLGLINNFDKVEVFNNDNIEELYLDHSFVEFLVLRPAVIAHPSSFNLYKKFFKELVTYAAPKDLFSVKRILSNEQAKKYLDAFDGGITFDTFLENISKRGEKVRSETDFLVMAFSELCKERKDTTEGASVYE